MKIGTASVTFMKRGKIHAELSDVIQSLTLSDWGCLQFGMRLLRDQHATQCTSTHLRHLAPFLLSGQFLLARQRAQLISSPKPKESRPPKTDVPLAAKSLSPPLKVGVLFKKILNDLSYDAVKLSGLSMLCPYLAPNLITIAKSGKSNKSLRLANALSAKLRSRRVNIFAALVAAKEGHITLSSQIMVELLRNSVCQAYMNSETQTDKTETDKKAQPWNPKAVLRGLSFPEIEALSYLFTPPALGEHAASCYRLHISTHPARIVPLFHATGCDSNCVLGSPVRLNRGIPLPHALHHAALILSRCVCELWCPAAHAEREDCISYPSPKSVYFAHTHHERTRPPGIFSNVREHLSTRSCPRLSTRP